MKLKLVLGLEVVFVAPFLNIDIFIFIVVFDGIFRSQILNFIIRITFFSFFVGLFLAYWGASKTLSSEVVFLFLKIVIISVMVSTINLGILSGFLVNFFLVIDNFQLLLLLLLRKLTLLLLLFLLEALS